MSSRHLPILVAPIVDALLSPLRALPPGAPAENLLDCTLGGGGHTAALLAALAAEPALERHKIVAIDQDERAVAAANSRFAKEIAEGRLTIHHARISTAETLAVASAPLAGVLADLGFSSDQIEDPSRGLSFQGEGPLDMRMDPTRGTSCLQYLRQVTEPTLADVLREYGEERFAGRIASAIVDARREKKLPTTSTALAELITRAVPPGARYGRIHSATRTFQALRIVVNDELGELDVLLTKVLPKLRPGGRAAVLSFHSLEDRAVKRAFRDGGEFEPVTKKPVEAGDDEVRTNPRARSAKLRVAERLAVPG